jgi:hypothetical protein
MVNNLMNLSKEEINDLFNDLIMQRGPDLICSNCGETLGDAPGEDFASISVEIEYPPSGPEVCVHLTCKPCRQETPRKAEQNILNALRSDAQ